MRGDSACDRYLESSRAAAQCVILPRRMRKRRWVYLTLTQKPRYPALALNMGVLVLGTDIKGKRRRGG